MPSFIISEKKEKHLEMYVIGALRVKPFLVYCTATAHKRISVREIAFYLEAVKFTDNSTT